MYIRFYKKNSIFSTIDNFEFMRYLIINTLILSFLFSLNACKKKGCTDPKANNYNSSAKKGDGSCLYTTIEDDGSIEGINSVKGYGMLSKLPGIWNGSVTSSTPLGNFPEWIVDFRPISPSQVSAKNELDSLNDIFMSFFICKHNNEYKMAFRNGGGFAGSTRNSYLIIDSLSETANQSFYRFVDPVAGADRVYTDVTFKQDSLILHVYTNYYNTLSTAVTHMLWKAKRKDLTSCQNAISQFNFPQKQLTKDFTTTFNGLSEAIFYSTAADPYPEQDQPYLGKTQVTINVTNPVVVDPSKKIMIIMSTKPLFNGFIFNTASLDTRSRYVFIGADDLTGFNFNYMHPGTYYVNAVYDSNGDYHFSTGDYMNSSFDVPVTLNAKGNSNANVTINFQIP